MSLCPVETVLELPFSKKKSAGVAKLPNGARFLFLEVGSMTLGCGTSDPRRVTTCADAENNLRLAQSRSRL
jgi:hypothetical protein